MYISEHSFSDFFSPDLVKAMASECSSIIPEPDTILFEEEDAPDLMYLVLEGRVLLSKQTIQGHHVAIATVEGHDYFGEFGVVDDLVRSARAITDGYLEMATIPVDLARRYIQLAPGSALLGMTTELQDYAKGQNTCVLTPIDPADVVESVWIANRTYLENRDIGLIIDAEPCKIRGDATELERMIQNSLNNSAEALASGGEIEGSCGGDDAGGTVTLRVADNGPRIPESIGEALFEPFVTEGKRPGTGLGMAIAKSAVEAHGGSIVLEDTSSGASFRIELAAL